MDVLVFQGHRQSATPNLVIAGHEGRCPRCIHAGGRGWRGLTIRLQADRDIGVNKAAAAAVIKGLRLARDRNDPASW